MKEGSIGFFTSSAVYDDSFHIGIEKQVLKKTSTVQKEFNDNLKHIDRKNIQFEVPEFNLTMRKCKSPEATVELSNVFRGKPHISLRTSGPAVEQATILIGSSTLSHLWRAPDFKPSSPINFDCVIGGRVSDIRKMFLMTYKDYESPLNVIVCCGVNDIAVQCSEETILQLKTLAQTIMENNTRNKIVISTILFAPKFCYRGSPDYLIHIRRTRHINNWINSFNAGETGLNLDMSKFGISESSSIDGGIRFAYEDWKEDEVNKKLHLSYAVKKKVAVEVTELCNALQHKQKIKITQNATRT